MTGAYRFRTNVHGHQPKMQFGHTGVRVHQDVITPSNRWAFELTPSGYSPENQPVGAGVVF
jgi:hypothetical protein